MHKIHLMRHAALILGFLVVACTSTTETASVRDTQRQSPDGWNKQKAADWLDARAEWWLNAEKNPASN